MLKFENKGVILCDEIRQEMSGKYIIIGAYPSGLLVQSIPANIGLSLYLNLAFSEVGSHEIVIDIKYLDNHAKMAVNLDVAIPDAAMAVPTPRMPFIFSEPCEILVSVGFHEEALLEVARFSVGVNPEIWTMYPIELMQPSEQ